MVTTIKITCDGVFIQSNSFLSNGHHHHRVRGPASAATTSGSTSPALLKEGASASADRASSISSEEDHPMSTGNGGGSSSSSRFAAKLDRDGNNNRDLEARLALFNEGNFNKIARRRYQSEEVLTRHQKLSGGSEGSDTVDAACPSYCTSESEDQFTISFLNTRTGGHQNGKSFLNQKFIVYNSKKPKPSTILYQNGGYHHPSQYRQFLNGRLKPAFSTSVLSSPSLISAAVPAAGSGTASGRPAAATPPPNLLLFAKSTSWTTSATSPAPSSPVSSLSPSSSGRASDSPTPPVSSSNSPATNGAAVPSSANLDVYPLISP